MALAVQLLPAGPRGVGYVDAVLGIGAVVGGFVAISRSSRHSLATDLLKGVLLWSLPLLLVVVWPSLVSVFVAVALLGSGNPIADVNFYTAVQRLTPDRVLGCVFGALEGALIATMALGAAVMPFLIEGPGLRTAPAVVSLVVGLPTLALLPAARGVDRRLTAPPELELLSSWCGMRGRGTTSARSRCCATCVARPPSRPPSRPACCPWSGPRSSRR